MKETQTSTHRVKIEGPAQQASKHGEERVTASGRSWSAVQRVRLPHKPGLPLSSGGGGDGAA